MSKPVSMGIFYQKRGLRSNEIGKIGGHKKSGVYRMFEFTALKRRGFDSRKFEKHHPH